MAWFFLFLLLVVALLMWLPVRVEIDSREEKYRVDWQGIMGVRCVPEGTRWQWFFRIFLWEKEWRPGQKTATPKPRKKNRKLGPKRRPGVIRLQKRALVRNLLHTIEVKHFRVNWDMGDFMYNAWLYPFFFLASGGKKVLRVNFFGQQELSVLLQIRPYRLLTAVLRTFFHSK